MKIKNKKVVKIKTGVIATIVILCALFYFAIYIPIDYYIDTHMWATITVTGEVMSDTSDAFFETMEYSKGDTLNVFGETTLLIEDITHEGVVSLSVSHGSLYNDDGEEITSFTINRGEKVSYKLENGFAAISVDSSRYQ